MPEAADGKAAAALDVPFNQPQGGARSVVCVNVCPPFTVVRLRSRQLPKNCAEPARDKASHSYAFAFVLFVLDFWFCSFFFFSPDDKPKPRLLKWHTPRALCSKRAFERFRSCGLRNAASASLCILLTPGHAGARGRLSAFREVSEVVLFFLFRDDTHCACDQSYA